MLNPVIVEGPIHGGVAVNTQLACDESGRRLAATAAEIRAEHGGCAPTALVVVNRVPFSLDVVLNSDDDKQALRRLFEVAARGGAEACALVAEAWQFGGDRSKLRRAIRHALEGKFLADLRGRQEILFVHAASTRAEELRVFEIGCHGRSDDHRARGRGYARPARAFAAHLVPVAAQLDRRHADQERSRRTKLWLKAAPVPAVKALIKRQRRSSEGEHRSARWAHRRRH